MSMATLTFCPTSSPADYDVEYRAIVDDAWYSVRTVLDGEKLTVKYVNFTDDHDNVFQPQDFKSLEEIEAFKERFRPVSIQLQDQECKNLSEGTVVCASHSFTDLDVRFYDAVVDAQVIYRNHSVANGQEQCMCTFVVIWQHGPVFGCLANKKTEHICLLQSKAKLNPNVAIFLKTVREKLETAAYKPHYLSNCNTLHKDIASLPMKPQSTFTPQFTQEAMCTRWPVTSRGKSEEIERICNHTQREDTDVGGNVIHYVVLIDNLDKELSASTIVEFVRSQTSVLVQAYVFPSMPSETYTNGIIVLDCEKDFQKLREFLDSPNHIIMSWSGRPWLMTKMFSGHNTNVVPLGPLMTKYQNKSEHKSTEISHIKVVYSGAEEYNTAKQLRDLFVEFVEHQQQLHRTLALEEKKILQRSPLVNTRRS